jgi:hypothetical protein
MTWQAEVLPRLLDHPLEPVIGLAEWRDPVADDDSHHD